jgi:hypothetical protein
MNTNSAVTNSQAVPNTQVAPADTPQPVTTMTPEAVVEALRALRPQIGNVTPLTSAQRRTLRSQSRTSNPVLQASLNVLGALDSITQVIGTAPAEVRQMYDEANRWTAVEDELRTLLNGVSSANLIRRQQISFVATQAATIGSRLARDPANAVLVPHVQEVKRLKSFTRRKKAPQAPGTPQSPASGTTQASGSATVSQVPGTPGSHQG